MSGQFPPLPEACARTLARIEADPLDLPEEAAAHLATCPACAEARVAWLAQDDAEDLAEAAWTHAPAGYFERLPDRVLGKLPPVRRTRPVLLAHRGHLALWALAATLLAAVAIGGFWAGRANRTPLVEATLVQPPAETRETLPDAPFQEADDDYTHINELSPEQAHVLLERVRTPAQHP
jgi:hypothetical protein